MRMFVLLQLDVSPTIAETMQRSGFTVAPDGSNMQVRVPNAPAIPQRKINLAFIQNPTQELASLVQVCTAEPAAPPAT